MFKTQFMRKRYYSNPGIGTKVVYASKIDKNGHLSLYEKGKEDVHGFIQSFAESVDINVLIKKFAATGDATLLQQRKADYMDLTDVPTSYFEAVNKLNDAKQMFDKLPVDIKKKFDFNPNKFILSIGTPEANLLLAGEENIKKEVIEEKKGEVTNE